MRINKATRASISSHHSCISTTTSMLLCSVTRTLALTTLLSSNGLFASATPQNNDENALLQTCLTDSVGGDATRAQFSSGENFSTEYVKPYNRQYPYTPFAVMYPKNAEEVGEMVKCASENNRKVQARSGGHDYVSKCTISPFSIVCLILTTPHRHRRR